jgi:hypothetical protein
MKANTLHFATAILASLFVFSTASADPQQYVIKQSVPSTGSSIKRPIVITGTIPLDERYAELTPEQKNSLKSLYEKMGDNDEPPFPLHGLRPLYEALGKAHEQLELTYRGPVTLYVDVDSQGRPGNMSLVESPDQQIAQAAANVLATQKFKPAVCNGTPCAMRYVFHAELVGPDVHDMKSANPSTGIQVSKTSG